MRVELNVATFQKHGACERGLGLFKRTMRDMGLGEDASLTFDWTPLHTMWLASRFPDLLDWLQSEGIAPTPELRELMVDGVELHSFDLSGKTLWRCTFVGCDFTHAKFVRSRFLDCTFYGCTFDYALMTQANFVSTVFEGCSFNAVRLKRSVLSSVRFEGCDLRGVDFRYADCSLAPFIDCRLDGANFNDASVYGDAFTRSSLKGATFERAHPESDAEQARRMARGEENGDG